MSKIPPERVHTLYKAADFLKVDHEAYSLCLGWSEMAKRQPAAGAACGRRAKAS